MPQVIADPYAGLQKRLRKMIGFAAHLTADPPQYCTPKAKQAGQCSRCHRSTIKDCSICLDRMRFCCISSSRTTRHRLHQEPALLQEATDPLHRICTERTPGSLHVAAAHHATDPSMHSLHHKSRQHHRPYTIDEAWICTHLAADAAQHTVAPRQH